jgi:hypothetical protein
MRVAANLTLMVALLAIGFWLGFREGAQVALMVEAVPRGGMSLFHLSHLNQGAPTKNMTLPSSGRHQSGFAALRPPLMSNVSHLSTHPPVSTT